MIKVGIIGATGYAGGELVRLLTQHKDAQIVWYGSRSYIDQKYYSVYGNMFQIVDDKCMDDNMEQLADQVDVIFTATPQGDLASMLTEEILSKVKIIDLSADYRIKDVATYEKWYGIEHKSPQFIEEAVHCVNINKVCIHFVTENTNNLFRFAFTKETVVYMYTYQLLSDCFDQQSCYYRRVNTAGKCKKNLLVAYLLFD